MPYWAQILVVLVVAALRTTGECPATCECKWKSGKESVICNGRNLTGVPQHLDTGTQLIDLSGNNLTSIKENEFSTARLLNLQKVFLSRCSLKTLHPRAFQNLINLVDLDLSYNNLTAVPSHTFDSILELMELKLNGNPIGAVRNNSFKSVPHLNKLDLSECRIGYIEINAFAGLEMSLEWLKLDKNQLLSIKPLSITILGNLHGLELAGNPWNCSCGLRPLREWVLRHNIPHTISPVCKSPPRLAGRLWDKLDLDDFACLPKVAAVSPEKSSQEGTNVTMSCIIKSIPVPSVRWLKKERIIANLSGLHTGGRHLFTVQVANTESNLTITGAEMGDSGEYVCRAENKAGKAEARIHLAITLKPEEPPWSTKVIIATSAVVILFSTAAVLLIICICSLWKRQRVVHRHGAVPNNADAYEMNNKAVKPYDKVIRSGTGKWGDDLGREREFRNGCIAGADQEHSEDHNNMNPTANQNWGSDEYNDDRETTDNVSPDLHIPRLKDRRSDDVTRSPCLSSAVQLLQATPTVRTHVLRKEVRGPNKGTLYTSCSDTDNYPDLLESDKNTLPRRGYKQRRTRTGSCGSESLSPLLQGSSDESCDSTPMPLLDIPDPYPELDKFLKEYRNLQEQLYKMKESCENLKQENLRFKAESGEPKTISRLMDDVYKNSDIEPMYSVYNTTAVEPLYNATPHLLNDSLRNVLLSANAGEENNKPRKEEQALDFQSENYWLTRSKLLNTLSDSSPRPSFYDS